MLLHCICLKVYSPKTNKKQNRLPKILEHASGDKRFQILETHMKKHQFKQDALIEVLRSDYDDDEWASALDEARARQRDGCDARG